MIGAPKMGQGFDGLERGEVYKCSFGRRGFCTEFNPQTKYIQPETVRDKQFLGFSMDASDKFVVSGASELTFQYPQLISFADMFSKRENQPHN